MSVPDSTQWTGDRSRPKQRILGWLSVITSAVLVAGSLTAYGFYRQLVGNIRQHDVLSRLGDDRPDKAGEAENILLIGSDSRAGPGPGYQTTIGGRSDTLILLHLSAKRDKAALVSFPRDSLVDIPSCQTSGGSVQPPRTGMVNEAFSIGGPACSWRTIEAVTGIRIDHFVQVDFSGFKNMVNALGGVQVCLPQAVSDPRANLYLPAGRHVVSGEQALGYVRTRYALGDGSDLERIKRQQKFMAAMIKKATSTRLLFDPARLYRFLNAATRSVSTDRGLDLGDLKRLADSVKGMDTGEVTFLTVPNQPAPSDPNRLVWTQPAADQLFAALRNDTALPLSGPSPGASGPVIPPSQVELRVLNGTDISGLANRTAEQLRARGFQVLEVGNTETPATATVVRHPPDAQGQARVVANVVQGARTLPDVASTGAVDLVIGGDWQGLQPSSGEPGQPGAPSPSNSMTAADNLCA